MSELPTKGQRITLLWQGKGDGTNEGFEINGMLVVPAEEGVTYVRREDAKAFFGLVDDAALSRLRDTQRVLVEALREARGFVSSDYTGSSGRDMSGGALARIDAALASVEQPEQPYPTPAGDEEVPVLDQKCLPNGVMFDAFGRERVRYVRVTLDGSHLILHPNELEAWKVDEPDPDQFTYTDVYLSPEEADALPEFDGF